MRENWKVAKLKVKHPSVPFNPDIANFFFRAGLIEVRGRGTIKIREKEVLIKLTQGLSSKQIADTLKISINTVSKHCQNMLVKTGSKSTGEPVNYEVRMGLV